MQYNKKVIKYKKVLFNEKKIDNNLCECAVNFRNGKT